MLLKYAVITNIFSHYRKYIFDVLVENGFTIFADSKSKNSIKTFEVEGIKNFVQIRNVYIGKFVIWQKGIIKESQGFNRVILIGDMYILSSWIILVRFYFKQDSKIFLWGHGLRGNESFLKLQLRLIFFNLADGLLVYGNRAKRELENLGYSKKIEVVYNSLDYNTQSELSKQVLNIDECKKEIFGNSNKTIIYSGRINKMKKLNLLIEAVSILEKKNKVRINILIVGEGEYLEKLRKKSKDLGVNCHFFGPCYNEKILSNLFRLSDVGVSPGDIGLFAMHSLVYGTPVVTHDNLNSHGPEHEAIIPNVTGAFFKMDDSNSLCNVLYNMIFNLDLQKMSKECQKLIKKSYTPLNQYRIIQEALD